MLSSEGTLPNVTDGRLNLFRVGVSHSLSRSSRRLPIFDTFWPHKKNLSWLFSGFFTLLPVCFGYWISLLVRCKCAPFFLITVVGLSRQLSSAFVHFYLCTFLLAVSECSAALGCWTKQLGLWSLGKNDGGGGLQCLNIRSCQDSNVALWLQEPQSLHRLFKKTGASPAQLSAFSSEKQTDSGAWVLLCWTKQKAICSRLINCY